MKKIIYLPIVCFLLLTACSKERLESSPAASNELRGRLGDGGAEYCAEKTVNLMAGQTMLAGSVLVEQDADNIYVTYTTTGGWVLTATHLYVGPCNAIPVNNPGNPIPGQFPYSGVHSNLTTYTYTIPVSAIGIGNCGCIAAHAVVKKLDASGAVVSSQTAWGQGTVINPNGNWGMKFDFCPVACP